MEEIYKIKYHYLVDNDLQKISPPLQKRILVAIKEKLSLNPVLFGKPLRYLRSYRRIRVGDYRIIYKIEKHIVYILIIQHRSVIYRKISERIK